MQSFLKAKADKPLEVGFSPHLHSRASTSKILWGTVAATVPIILGSFIFFGWNALRIYSVAILSGLCFEYGFELFTGQKSRIRDGSTILTAILFSFLMPPNMPVSLIVAGIFVSVIVAKELFGGLGQNLFHPVLVGYASVLAFFPDMAGQSQMLGCGNVLFILIGGLFLLFQKWIRWETAFVYLASVSLGFYVGGSHLSFLSFGNFLILIALFFITESASGPMASTGRIIFSGTAGLLTAAFSSWMSVPQAVASAVLLSNSTVPLIDYVFKK